MNGDVFRKHEWNSAESNFNFSKMRMDKFCLPEKYFHLGNKGRDVLFEYHRAVVPFC